nr:hypothetical protein [uncultured Prevotella sp.]
MKTIIKYSHIALLAVIAFAFSACTDEYDYDSVETVNNEGAYILANGKTTLYWNDTEDQAFSVVVARHDDSEAKTYKLTTSDGSVSVPAEVSFEANEKSKVVPVTCHFNVGDIKKKVTIGIADEDAYTYGAHSQTYTISRCKTFEGKFMSEAFGNEDGTPAEYPVTVYECGVTTNEETGKKTAQYLISNVYDFGYDVMFTLKDNGKAATEGQPAWTHPNYGDVYVSGNGTYYSSQNCILFLWSHDIPNLGGFGITREYLFFPDGYDPFNQVQTETQTTGQE